jgi:hypothetical protein
MNFPTHSPEERADGFDRDAEPICDLLVAIPTQEERHDVHLSWSKRFIMILLE